MPIYTFVCPECGLKNLHARHMKNADKKCICSCGADMRRDFQADLFNSGNKEYGKTKFSDALAISPEQVTEHKKLFPDIPIDNQCRPGFDNYKQHDNYLEKTGFRKKRQKIRKRGKRIA